MPESPQAEGLGFLEYLKSKKERKEEDFEWFEGSFFAVMISG
jgi:hypothetical protein